MQQTQRYDTEMQHYYYTSEINNLKYNISRIPCDEQYYYQILMANHMLLFLVGGQYDIGMCDNNFITGDLAYIQSYPSYIDYRCSCFLQYWSDAHLAIEPVAFTDYDRRCVHCIVILIII